MRRAFFLLSVSVFTTVACGGEDLVLPGGPEPAEIEDPSATRSTISVDPALIPAGSGTSTIRVTIRNSSGAPIEGASVTVSASGSGNTVAQPSGPTGSDGVAIGMLSSTVPGTKDVTATINGTLQINQTAQVSVVGAPAARIEPLEGDDQRSGSGTTVPVPPAVRVTNALGQPVAGVDVTFVVTEGGGTVTGTSQSTNSEGIARVGSWTLGSPGRNRLEARAGSLSGSPVVFTATATQPVGDVHHFVFRVPPHDVEEDEYFTVEVAMVDAAGTVVPLSGIEIYLGLFREDKHVPANDRLQGDRFRDTDNGIAVFRLAVTKEGRYRFRALSDELPALGPHGPEPWLFSNAFSVD